MTERCNCSRHPVIIVPGIGQSKTEMLDSEGNKLLNSWPLEIDGEVFKNMVMGSAAKSLLLRRDCGLSNALYLAVGRALDPLKCNPDGTCKNNIRVITYDKSIAQCDEDEKRFIYKMVPLKDLSETIGEDHMFYFAFNPFGNPYESADRLDKFVQTVKEKTGHDKVNVIAISLGAAVASAYLDAYGDEGDVNRLLGFVPAFDGTTVANDLLSGIYTREYEELLSMALGKKDSEKVLGLLRFVPQRLSVKLFETLIEAFVDTAVVNTPMMWSVVPAKYYEKLRDRYLSDPEHAKLREIAERAYSVRKDFPALAKKLEKVGTKVFIICGYNIKTFTEPLPSGGSSSDIIVDASSASMGAFCAPLGHILPEEYEQKNPCCGRKHISPDRLIDASCGAFPDTTWFFRGTDHEASASTGRFMALAKDILGDGQVTDVFSSPQYPQFS